MGDQLAVPQREIGRGVVEHIMAASLRLQEKREGGIPVDIDPLDRVHLKGDFESHDVLAGCLCRWLEICGASSR